MPWWMWVVGGLVLFILEVWTPTGFFLTFFGIGAILVGALARIGAVESDWMQWLLFSTMWSRTRTPMVSPTSRSRRVIIVLHPDGRPTLEVGTTAAVRKQFLAIDNRLPRAA